MNEEVLGSAALAFDGTTAYYHYRIFDGANHYRTQIGKITGVGNLATQVWSALAGAQSVTAVAATSGLRVSNGVKLDPTANQGSIDNSIDHFAFQAAGGKLFLLQDDGILYTSNTADANPVWWQQSAGAVSNFIVNATGTTFYFFSGAALYRRTYSATGLGSDTLVYDFNGILASPKLQTLDPLVTAVLYIIDRGVVYRFTHPSIL